MKEGTYKHIFLYILTFLLRSSVVILALKLMGTLKNFGSTEQVEQFAIYFEKLKDASAIVGHFF